MHFTMLAYGRYLGHTKVAKHNPPVVAAWGAAGSAAPVWPLAIHTLVVKLLARIDALA